MTWSLAETPLEGDRARGLRVFLLTAPDDEAQLRVEVAHLTNADLYDEARRFEPSSHPLTNAGLLEPFQDLTLGLRANSHRHSLPSHSPSPSHS